MRAKVESAGRDWRWPGAYSALSRRSGRLPSWSFSRSASATPTIAKYSRDGLVFTAREGGTVCHRNFCRRHYRPAVAASRAKSTAPGQGDDALPQDLRFHDLRHTCAAFLIDNGRHMEAVKEHLGHSSIRVTSDRYGHLFPAARQAIADGLDSVYRDSLVESPADNPRTATTSPVVVKPESPSIRILSPGSSSRADAVSQFMR